MSVSDASVSHAELIENVTATAQRLINAERDNSQITPAFIADKVSIASKLFAKNVLEANIQDHIVTTLIQRFSHWIGRTTTLHDNTGHIAWLNAAQKSKWQYWRRYRDYLESKLAEKVIEGLDDATNNILELLEDPGREGNWDRRGLVVGHVQSGKTSNYSGLICKAADVGYKIIIVLAGTQNSLRSQTQVRLEESFLGYETTTDRDIGPPIGVAFFGENLKTNSGTTRAENGDFNSGIARHFTGISPEERPWLFVVKKQKNVLTQLLRWIQSRVADTTDATDSRKIVSQLPLLMIDDEADNASVDTGEKLFDDSGAPDVQHQPKTINSLIRQILHSFTRKAYVGYTATPFANIFIHHKGVTTKEGPDLFPRSFIINLAAPTNYVGPAKIFGTRTSGGRSGGLPLIRLISDHFDKDTASGWMPPRHKTTHVPVFNGQETIPHSLRKAIYSFVLACATRTLRGQGGEHSSMLIHVTRFNLVQKQVRDQVDEVVRRMAQRITQNIDSSSLLDDLHALWIEDFLPTRNEVAALSSDADKPDAMHSWDDILKMLPETLSDIKVRSINGHAKDALDYATPGSPLKVIAIGGDKLARGLTLEGLCVSYFVRTTKMYDTLMQMGRWFGYRPGYLDLCRLYTSSDLVEWFGHIADASEELREEFDFMAEAKLTPVQYGLKVMSHEVMTVTSPLKMRSARALSLSYSGTRPQTILFHRDSKVQKQNLAATDSLISSLGSGWQESPKYARDGDADSWPYARLWLNVDASNILSFLNSYSTHPNATAANAPVLYDFVNRMVSNGQLTNWSVGLLSGGNGTGDPHTFPGGRPVTNYAIRRTQDSEIGDNTEAFAIGVLTDPKDESIDLPDHAWREALKLTRASWKPEPGRGRVTVPSVPSGKGIREARKQLGGDYDRGLLLLYPLTPYYYDAGKQTDQLIVPGWSKPIMAFAIAFPESNRPISVDYKVNLLYWMQEYGPSE